MSYINYSLYSCNLIALLGYSVSAPPAILVSTLSPSTCFTLGLIRLVSADVTQQSWCLYGRYVVLERVGSMKDGKWVRHIVGGKHDLTVHNVDVQSLLIIFICA